MKKQFFKLKRIGVGLVLLAVIFTSMPNLTSLANPVDLDDNESILSDIVPETQEILDENVIEDVGDIIEEETDDIDELIAQMNPDIPRERLEEILNPVIDPQDTASSRSDGKTGLMPIKVTYFEEELTLPEGDSVPAYSAASESYWSKYSSSYYRNRMSYPEQMLYDRLYQYCMWYLTSYADMDFRYYSNWIPIGDIPMAMNMNSLSKVYNLFANANPQFYFLLHYIEMGSVNGVMSFYFSTFEDFVDGYERMGYTDQIQRTIDSWVSQVNAAGSPYNKIKKIYELIATNVYYDYDFSNIESHQSCATAILLGRTVCAGYAELFSFLARGAGFESICVTSDYHEWNQVFVEGRWYNIDITWDDNDDPRYPVSYNYFLISDNTLYALDGADHWPEWDCADLRPTCPADYTPLKSGVLYRFSRPDGGDWLLTSDLSEINQLANAGWSNDGEVGNVGRWGEGTAVIRFYNRFTNDRMYSNNAREISNYEHAYGWVKEGPAFYSSPTAKTPVIRYATPTGVHIWSIDSAEQRNFDRAGWDREGEAFRVN